MRFVTKTIDEQRTMFITFLISLLSVPEFFSVSGKREDSRNTFNSLNWTNMENWTSCEEFLHNTTFDRANITEVNWKIFYFWNPQMETSYNLIFHVPSNTLIDRYTVELDDDMKPPVNWTAADLFLETSVDFSALFIKTNVSGLYRAIPSIAFQVKSLSPLLFALKLVEPGYLGIVNCQYRLAYALAPVDSMPAVNDIEKAAALLNFKSEFGRPYTVEDPIPKSIIAPVDKPQDDADDDEQLEIEVDSENLQIF